MAAKISPAPLSYSQAADALGTKTERTIGHNTKLIRVAPDCIRATYHGNAIVEYTPDAVMATWAGWGTATTRDRLNQLTTGRFNIKDRRPHTNGKEVDPYAWVEIH
jgi:hypothetical protein